MKRSYNFKLAIIGFAIACIVFVYIGNMRRVSSMPIDSFWRYQGNYISEVIKSTGHLYIQNDSNNTLISWVDQFRIEQISPLFVVITGYITGESLINTQYLPVLAVPWIIAQGLLARSLIKSSIVFPISVATAVSYHFLNIQLLSTIHRVTMGWTLLFFLLALFLRYRKNYEKKFLYLSFILIVPFVFSYKTLTVAIAVFFGVFLFSDVMLKSGRSLIWISVLAVTSVTAYVLVVNWLGISVATVISFIRSPFLLEASETSLRLAYSRPLLFTILNFAARLIAVIAALTVVIYRLGINKNDPGLNPDLFDLFLISLAAQAGFNAILTIAVPASSGVHVLELGQYFAPVFIPAAILIIYNRYKNKWGKKDDLTRVVASTIIIIMILTPGVMTSLMISTDDSLNIQAQTQSDISSADWSSKYTEGRVASDFSLLSTFIVVDGINSDRKVYSPSINIPNESRDIFYNPPPNKSKDIQVIIIDRRMEITGIYMLKSYNFKPNPILREEMDKTTSWSRSYDSGENTVYVNT